MKALPSILMTVALLLTSHGGETNAATDAAPVSPTAGRTPIRSRAELDRYLEVTPLARSPLLLLPTGARRRFLNSLAWGENGLGGFNGADLQQYLTNPQINTVLTLFGSQSYAAGIHGRAAPLATAQRTAPETPLELKFDKLYFANEDHARGGKPFSDVPQVYERLLASYQTSPKLTRLNDSDVGLLFRGATLASYASHELRYLGDLRLDLVELHRRRLATEAQINDVHDQLVAARRFGEADALAREYPSAAIAPLPPLRQAPNLRHGSPTVLLMKPDGKQMLRKAIDIRKPLRIIVIAGCHFSVSAVRAIRADPQLGALFHRHAVWLANENESLTDVRDWNRSYPDQPMNVAWRDSEWTLLESWAIPTFYVFRSGKLLDQWSGWPGSVNEIRTHLTNDGILPASISGS